MPPPPRLLRRLILAPLAIVVSLLYLLLSPALLILALLADIYMHRHRSLRVVGFGFAYALYEVICLGALFGLWIASGFGLRLTSPAMQERHYRLMAWWLRGLRAAGTTLFGVRILVEDAPKKQAGPILVFSRHGGAGNSLLLVAALMLEYDRHPRIIMLAKLQWEPLFDVMLHRVPNRFITHRKGERDAHLDAIKVLATGLGDRDAFVLFPEGHDFTPRLRTRAIGHLRKGGHHESADRAEAMPHVLPPRHGGVTAAIAAAPDADIAFVAHTTFEDVGSLIELWHRTPLKEPVAARYWRVAPSEVPQDPEAIIPWLYDWWERIDAWIGRRVARLDHEAAAPQVDAAPPQAEAGDKPEPPPAES